MDTVATKLKETGHLVGVQSKALVTRTTGAGKDLLNETREAGEDFVAFVMHEAEQWRRYVGRELTLIAFERRLLEVVDVSLCALDEQVKSRLAKLNKKRAPKRSRTRQSTPRTRAPRAASVLAA
jgi:hypothetical protein